MSRMQQYIEQKKKEEIPYLHGAYTVSGETDNEYIVSLDTETFRGDR